MIKPLSEALDAIEALDLDDLSQDEWDELLTTLVRAHDVLDERIDLLEDELLRRYGYRGDAVS
jgi:hypothetical protein